MHRMLRRTTSATSMRKGVGATLPMCGTVLTGVLKLSWPSSQAVPHTLLRYLTQLISVLEEVTY